MSTAQLRSFIRGVIAETTETDHSTWSSCEMHGHNWDEPYTDPATGLTMHVCLDCGAEEEAE